MILPRPPTTATATIEKEVGGHIEVVAVGQVLPHHRHPPLGDRPRGGGQPLAGQPDVAAGRRHVPRNATNQGRLAGAVLAGQGHHLPTADVEVDAIERPDSPEDHGEAPHTEQGASQVGRSGGEGHAHIMATRDVGRWGGGEVGQL